MTILVVEDDADIASLLQRGFAAEGYDVDIVGDGPSAVAAAELDRFEAIILDIMLPGQSGLDICRTLRSVGEIAPIIMLSARSNVSERAEGLLAGADDYVVKPFAFEELLARVRAHALRRQAENGNHRALESGRLRLQLDTRILKVGESSLRLTERESELLAFLMRHPGIPQTRQDIFIALWAKQGGASLNLVDVYIGYLRHKLASALPDGAQLIATVRGRGFMLTDDALGP